MKLVNLCDSDKKKAYEMYNKFLPDENGFENPFFGMDYDMFLQACELQRKHSQGIDLRLGYVPDDKYILVNDEDEYVGIFNFRHYLNDFLKNGAGHIGYGIVKEYRGRGYASIGLNMVLDICKERGIKEVYLSVNKDNPASLRVQIKNGAYIHHEDDKEYYTRINL